MTWNSEFISPCENLLCRFYPQNVIRLLSEGSFLGAGGLLTASCKLKDFKLYMLLHLLWGWQLVSSYRTVSFFKFKWACMVPHTVLLMESFFTRMFFLWSWNKQVVMTEHVLVTKSLLYVNPQASQTRKSVKSYSFALILLKTSVIC